MSWHLVHGVSTRRPTSAILWRHTQLGLPLFFAIAGMRLGWRLLRGRVRAVHLGDPVLSPLAWLAFGAGIPVVVTVHGLDLIYRNTIYQWLLARTLPRCASIICISTHVRELALARGLAPARVHLIPVGIAPEGPRAGDISQGLQATGIPPDAKVILTIGRLIPRKGVAWFIAEVFARLAREREDVRYVVIGAGPERRRLEELIRTLDLAGRVHLLGTQPENLKWGWLERAVLLAVPNVPVEGDVEGFGIVALEGALAGRTVLASRLEGLTDAVRDGTSGWLLPPGDPSAWTSRIQALLDDPDRLAATGTAARADVLSRFTWDRIVDGYCDVFDHLALAPR